MALIKCSECGGEISERASVCPKCGCPMGVTMKVISENHKKKMKIVKIASIIFSVIILIALSTLFLVRYNSPGNTAIRLVKKDYDGKVNVEKVYYNSEQKGCMVFFSSDGEEDIAAVHLKDKKVGYKSVEEEYVQKFEEAVSEDEKKKFAQQLTDYMDQYDIIWEYKVSMDDSKKSGWEKIK